MMMYRLNRAVLMTTMMLAGPGLAAQSDDRAPRETRRALWKLAETAAAAPAAESPQLHVSLWLVQFDATVAASELPIDVRALSESMPEYMPVRDGRIQTTGLARQLKLAELAVRANGHALTMQDGKLVSHTEDGATGAAPWQVLAAPRIGLAVGQQGVVSVGRPVSFMTRRDDGCLAVETDANTVEGAEISLTAKRADAREARFEDIRLRVTQVARREPLAGVPFDVGRPVLDTRETSLGITIPYGNVGIIPLPQGEHEPPILVFLTANRGDAADAPR